MRTEYDLIASLGGNCTAAAHLRRRGMRPYSLPFDWLFMDTPQTIEYLAGAFPNRFSDFCLKENLVPIEKAGQGAAGTARYAYRDVISGYSFVHHFHDSITTTGGYDKVSSMLKRRMDRFFQKIDSSNSILFILSTAFDFPYKMADDLIASLRRTYLEKHIDLYVVQHGMRFDDASTIAKKIIGHAFDGEVYDSSHSRPEWHFLDDVRMNGVTPKRIRGLDKIYYKIWKALSKRFRDGGYALDKISYR